VYRLIFAAGATLVVVKAGEVMKSCYFA